MVQPGRVNCLPILTLRFTSSSWVGDGVGGPQFRRERRLFGFTLPCSSILYSDYISSSGRGGYITMVVIETGIRLVLYGASVISLGISSSLCRSHSGYRKGPAGFGE